MFSKIIRNDRSISRSTHTEGELYKLITVHGNTFELRYGYYEDCDRQNPLCEPIVIYPDFLKEPVYTDDGKPFVTAVQDACRYYLSETKRTPDSTCAECNCFMHCEDWLGICTHRKRQK